MAYIITCITGDKSSADILLSGKLGLFSPPDQALFPAKLGRDPGILFDADSLSFACSVTFQ